MSTVSRRTKWHPTPPPPPSPKILHFPRSRRTRRRKQTKPATNPHNNPLLLMSQKYLSYKGNLESLFDQENHEPHGLSPASLNSNTSSVERRERVEEREGEVEEDCGGLAEEKWRFQAEMLRAECNLLRMEREFALKKLEKNRVKMERTLRSAVQTLLSGRKKIVDGKNGNAVLEEEIEDLAEKLDELQKNSRIKVSEAGNCSNFDKKACILQRRLEKIGGLYDENCVDELQQVADSCFPIANESSVSDCRNDNKSTDEAMLQENKCSGRCKAIVLRIVEQVRAETEQWSQMQKMLEQVRGEMEELQASRDYWESRAQNSDCEIQSLRHAVEEWKEKALDYEKQVNELEFKLSLHKEKMKKSKLDLRRGENNVILDLPPVPLGAQLVKERLALSCHVMNYHTNGKSCKPEKDLSLQETNIEESKKRRPKKELAPLSLAKQLAKEKRSLIRSLKENRDKGSKQELSEDGRRRLYSNSNGGVASTRSPLRDIGNSSPLARENHRSAFDYHSLLLSFYTSTLRLVGHGNISNGARRSRHHRQH